MITQEAINEYRKYDGDIDWYGRFNIKPTKEVQDAWGTMTDLIQNIYLVRKGLASREFAEKLQEKLKTNCDRPTTIQAMEQLTDMVYEKQLNIKL